MKKKGLKKLATLTTLRYSNVESKKNLKSRLVPNQQEKKDKNSAWHQCVPRAIASFLPRSIIPIDRRGLGADETPATGYLPYFDSTLVLQTEQIV